MVLKRVSKLGRAGDPRPARFTDAATVVAGGEEIRARRFVIATGSTPAVPPIPGLDSVDYLTNESVFDNRTAPARLIVIGAGPIGLELAQAHRRLGCEVVVLEAMAPLANEDPGLVPVVLEALALSEISRSAAIGHYAGLAANPWGRRVIGVVSWFG